MLMVYEGPFTRELIVTFRNCRVTAYGYDSDMNGMSHIEFSPDRTKMRNDIGRMVKVPKILSDLKWENAE